MVQTILADTSGDRCNRTCDPLFSGKQAAEASGRAAADVGCCCTDRIHPGH